MAERQAREQEKRERELAVRRSPGWFIVHELGVSYATVWYSFFSLLGGLGVAVALLTQSRYWALGTIAVTTLLAYLLGYHRTVHPLPKWLQRPDKKDIGRRYLSSSENIVLVPYIIMFFVIITICCIITLYLVNVVSPLNYSEKHTGTVLWLISKTWFLGKQIEAGLTIGVIIGVITAIWIVLKGGRGIFGQPVLTALFWSVVNGFLIWLACSIMSWFFNWGWGLGYGWGWGVIGLFVGIVGSMGLLSSLVICSRGVSSR
ncbi:MAG: hypothetical protein JOZ18_11320 [Chloroflexi bacterium]|nr:hypothetical protein [Chloroflexota bacterium]